ncbi:MULTISPECIES: MotA/TolQ/ExbB proton channel family protein [Shewanella]|uniref:MotA/TolQ/ExbB proton channel family protein n=1 Tax=Shewanella TaxID=22 RepID=UPI00048F95A3|nr:MULTISPECIES: MotA/TolQ/ExbB proton channel family protein [Shewanella]MDL2193661.1 MotA/TolQ/ExbB proton channel family protein [Shewanella algae]
MLTDVWSIGTAIPLLLCSIAGLALVAERTCYFIRNKGIPASVQLEVNQAIQARRLDDALCLVLKIKPFYLKALEVMVLEKDCPKSHRDEAVAIAMHYVSHGFKRRMSGILTIASLAPMLGLLGTIIGLMRSFKDIGIHDGPVEPSIVADGLWQALSTTAAGLIIAVFCVLAHALLASRARQLLSDCNYLLNKLSHEYEHYD